MGGATHQQKKATALISVLRGNVLDVLQRMYADEQNNFSMLVERTGMRFRDRHLEQVYQAQLKNNTSTVDETCRSSSRLMSFVLLAWRILGLLLTLQKISPFRYSLTICEFGNAASLAKKTTLHDAFTHAVEFEAAKHT